MCVTEQTLARNASRVLTGLQPGGQRLVDIATPTLRLIEAL